MYKRYKLENNQDLVSLVKEYSNYGDEIIEANKRDIKKSLDEYINQQGYINMSDISKEWFPLVKCDIFLSHSHNDLDIVKGLVGFFKKRFNIDTFVDSYIWGYCNDLLREIDNKYCRKENSFFDYDKRNYSTAHVHMMLSNSLNKMINKSECIIFLESENSLDVKEIIENGTSSPWIYSELIATKLIQIKPPKRFSKEEKRAVFENSIELPESFKPMYRGEVSHLEKLTVHCLKSVENKNLTLKEEYLDEIYKTATL